MIENTVFHKEGQALAYVHFERIVSIHNEIKTKI